MKNLVFLSKSPNKTRQLGGKLGRLLLGGEIIALEGDLGGGKTLFTKGIACGLGIKREITSPSFVVMKKYPAFKLFLYHFDFYRIDNPADVVGWELKEAIADKKSIIVIEWGQKIEKILPKERLEIVFGYVGKSSRKLIFKAKGERYEKIIKNLKLKTKNDKGKI